MQSVPDEGFVCRKCWLKVSIFHEFYDYVQSVHATGHTVFLECDLDVKEDIEVDLATKLEIKVENRAYDSTFEIGDEFARGSDDNEADVDFNAVEPLFEKIAQNIEKVEEKPKQKRKAKKSSDVNVKKCISKGTGSTFQ